MMKRLISLVLVAFCAFGWFTVFNNQAQEQKEIEDTLQMAYDYAERGLPYYSATYFSKALASNMDQNTYKQYLVQLYQLNSNNIYYDALEMYREKFPDDPDTYGVLLKRYHDTDRKADYFALYNETAAKGFLTDEMNEIYKEMFYKVSILSGKNEEARSYIGNTAAICNGGKWGLIGINGETIITSRYESIDVVLGDVFPVSMDGEAYFVGMNGEKMITTSKPVEWLSLMADGVCVARKDGKYALCDSAINVPDTFDFDYLSISSDGVLAAKKGDKWAIMKNTGEMVTDYIYDDIKIDPDRNCCIRNGVIFAKQGGKYIMVNAAGERIGTESFDDCKMFASDQPAAIKQGDKWGFVNGDGTLNGGVKYDEVGSFSMGLYAAKEDGVWGYKSPSGEFVIEPKYLECRPFTSNGRALVQTKDETWSFITIEGFDIQINNQ